MTDHKFTDEEVIKALECCVDNSSCKECPINPNHGNYGYCTNLALTHALDLINRQKAEIEKYKNLANADLIITRRIGNRSGGKTEATRQFVRIKTNLVKAEAIKEFAEAAKTKCYATYDEVLPRLFADIIDEVVKEILEEK